MDMYLSLYLHYLSEVYFYLLIDIINNFMLLYKRLELRLFLFLMFYFTVNYT